MLKKSFTTEAINLKSYPLNDNDSIVVMFSKTKGLMRAVAKGAKRPKSKLGARIQMFVANELMLLEGRNLDTIAQAQSVNTFSKIRNDLDKLSYSMYIAELVNNFCSKQFSEYENSSEIYSLIYGAYEKITNAKTKLDVMLIILKFQIKFMTYLGWGLDFNFCSACQNALGNDISKSSVFSYNNGGFLCENCEREGSTVRIHNKIRMFLNELSEVDFSQKTKYDSLLTESVVEKCFLFMKRYIDNLTNKKTKIFEVLECTTAAQ